MIVIKKTKCGINAQKTLFFMGFFDLKKQKVYLKKSIFFSMLLPALKYILVNFLLFLRLSNANL